VEGLGENMAKQFLEKLDDFRTFVIQLELTFEEPFNEPPPVTVPVDAKTVVNRTAAAVSVAPLSVPPVSVAPALLDPVPVVSAVQVAPSTPSIQQPQLLEITHHSTSTSSIKKKLKSREKEQKKNKKELEQIKKVPIIKNKPKVKQIIIDEEGLEVNSEDAADKTDVTLADQVIVFTGFRDDRLKSHIEYLGGHVVDHVTQKVTLVVTLNDQIYSSKIEKALNLGIKIVTKQNFIEAIQ
jgi:NAD-dependent DNA ligase